MIGLLRQQIGDVTIYSFTDNKIGQVKFHF